MVARAAPLRRRVGAYKPLHGAVALTDADRSVLRLLEGVPPRIWPRETLAAAASMKDRALRKSIERLRHGGFPVLSSSSAGGGYWLARTADEIRDFRERELHSRMRVIADESRVLGAVERLLRDREAQGSPVSQGALV